MVTHHESSRRTPGPITTELNCCRRRLPQCLNEMTRRMDPGSRFAWPGRRRECGRSSTPIQRRQPLPRRDVIDGVGVEERMERPRWPRHRWEPVARGPAVDLANVFHDQRVAKLLA